jgi:hypothetical protein
VGTGFPQKMRQNQKPRALSDSIESESALGMDVVDLSGAYVGGVV